MLTVGRAAVDRTMKRSSCGWRVGMGLLVGSRKMASTFGCHVPRIDAIMVCTLECVDGMAVPLANDEVTWYSAHL
jgi:hypothetical protein